MKNVLPSLADLTCTFISADTTVATFCSVSVLLLLFDLFELFFLPSHTRVFASPFIIPRAPCCGCLLVSMRPCVGVLCTLLQALSHSKNENFSPTIQKHNGLSRTKDDGAVYSRAVGRTPMMLLCSSEGAIWDRDATSDGVFHLICCFSTGRLVSVAWLLWMSARACQSAVQTLLCWVTLHNVCFSIIFRPTL